MALTTEELALVEKILGRKATEHELHCFEVMWSRELLYINTMYWIKQSNVDCFAEKKDCIPVADTGFCSLHIESNKYDCWIDPYHGAANGIGKAYRELYARGVKPLALMSYIQMGDVKDKANAADSKKITEGMADHANRIGTPMLDAFMSFDSAYSLPPLVNYFALGFCADKRRGASVKVKDLVVVLGDPIMIDDKERITKSAPYKEKVLQEFVLGAYDDRLIKDAKPLSVGGLVAASARICIEHSVGLGIDLNEVFYTGVAVPKVKALTEDKGERVLVLIDPKKRKELENAAEEAAVCCEFVGEIVEKNVLEIWDGNEILVSVAPLFFVEGHLFSEKQKCQEPTYLAKAKEFNIESIGEPDDYRQAAYALLKNPNIASLASIKEQYDSTVGTNHISRNFPSDAALLNIKKTNKALALTMQANARYVHADPFTGMQIMVAEAARKIVCTGAKPSILSNCINVVNPDNEESFWQFVQMVKGMNHAAHTLDVCIADDNVNFCSPKNEPLYPVPVIGMAGILEDKNYFMTKGFKEKGDMVFLLGENEEDMASSEYLASIHSALASPPPSFNLQKEKVIHEAVSLLIRNSFVRSAHSVAKGGLWVALLESAMVRGFGFDITTLAEIRRDAFLFGEAQGRVVVSVTPDKEFEFIDFMKKHSYPYIALGHVTKEEIRIDDISYGFISDLVELYETHMEQILIV